MLLTRDAIVISVHSSGPTAFLVKECLGTGGHLATRRFGRLATECGVILKRLSGGDDSIDTGVKGTARVGQTNIANVDGDCG